MTSPLPTYRKFLAKACAELLGHPEQGALAYIRFLPSNVTEELCEDRRFRVPGWNTWRVAEHNNESDGTISGDRAVELREEKNEPLLLVVDVDHAGAGLDGIYSAGRELREEEVLRVAIRLARRELQKTLSREAASFARDAVKKARAHTRRGSVPPWLEFDFYCQAVANDQHPAELLYILSLWPIASDEGVETELLDVSRLLVERLLGVEVVRLPPYERIATLQFENLDENRREELEAYLVAASGLPLAEGLACLQDHPALWINHLRLATSATALQKIELVPWRNTQGRLYKWSGLRLTDTEKPPELILPIEPETAAKRVHVEVRWRSVPASIAKGSVHYQVSIVDEANNEIASREQPHGGAKEEKCKFLDSEFTDLDTNVVLPAKIRIAVVGTDTVEPVETEEFIIRFGESDAAADSTTGPTVRAVSEALCELDIREDVIAEVDRDEPRVYPSKDKVVVRCGAPPKSFRLYRPPFFEALEENWKGAGDFGLGRWRVRVHSSGIAAQAPEFLTLDIDPPSPEARDALERLWQATRRFREVVLNTGGFVAQAYVDTSKRIDPTLEYLRAWAAVFDKGVFPVLALAGTVEVRSLSNRLIGLLVLPIHPIRVAWHSAYDNLVLYARLEENLSPKQIREEFAGLDGSLCPAFLPGLEPGQTFVFGDMLGFHTPAMVRQDDREPKATIAQMAALLEGKAPTVLAPAAGVRTAEVLGKEIKKYLECHGTPRFMHIHAIQPGDGLTVAKAISSLRKTAEDGTNDRANEDVEFDSSAQEVPTSFVVELYPSKSQTVIAGRYLFGITQRRRSGAGTLTDDDRWLMETIRLDGGVTMPRLRWARRLEEEPDRPAHLAVAFDTFGADVSALATDEHVRNQPLHAFGLHWFLQRRYDDRDGKPPTWYGLIPAFSDGEKHPAGRAHTDRITALQNAMLAAVARHLGADGSAVPALTTTVEAEQEERLMHLHRLCDWVITVDRHAGIEYFDSPNQRPEVYETYVIDCVPERDDLGSLQLITTTTSVDEVRTLLDGALDQMGLTRSRRNAEFLMGQLKALSGRLAIRLTGSARASGELIALALFHAQCRRASNGSDVWPALKRGFLMPIDDIQDILPPAHGVDDGEPTKVRPDLVYVSSRPREGLSFAFIEVKYRRHLANARSPQDIQKILDQTRGLRRRWWQHYCDEDLPASLRAIRRARLARVLTFYLEKARRHYLAETEYEELRKELDKMLKAGGAYRFAVSDGQDRGFIFCPEYAGAEPTEISPERFDDVRIYLFGPGALPDYGHDDPQAIASRNDGSHRAGERSGSDNGSEPSELCGDEEATSEVLLPERQPPAIDKGSYAPEERARAVQSHEGETTSEHQTRDGRSSTLNLYLGQDLTRHLPVHWRPSIEGNPHMMITGLPGMGKTTCLINLCRQLVAQDVRPIVFSYHQDIDQKLESCTSDLRFIDFKGLGFNPLQVMDRRSPHAYLDIAGTIRDIFSAIFPEIGDIQAERLRKAIKESFVERGWNNPSTDRETLVEPEFRRFYEILRSEPKPDQGLKNLLARLEELDDYGFFTVTEQWSSLWESKAITIIRIHSTQNENLQRAFAALVFYILYKDMFRRGLPSRLTHAIIFDEAHRASRLKLIPTMAKECRKYGLSLILASQEAKDFHASLYSAIANYLVLRLTDVDAKALVKNVASSDQEKNLIDRIKQMDRFRALYFAEGKRAPSYLELAEPGEVETAANGKEW